MAGVDSSFSRASFADPCCCVAMGDFEDFAHKFPWFMRFICVHLTADEHK